MAAYRRVYDSRHLQADCQEPGLVPEPYAWQLSMGCLYFLLAKKQPLFFAITSTKAFTVVCGL